MMGVMIQAFIFDCFGVLASDGLLPFLHDYLAHDPYLLQTANDLGRQVDRGLLDYDHFIMQLADMAGVSEQMVRQRIEHNVPNEALFAYIKTVLKPRFKIGFLSNAGRNWLGEIFEPWQLVLFDAVALSYEIGCIKPEPCAYQTVADKLHVPTEACVMVDDLERYVTGAKEAGMQALRYATFDEFKQTVDRQYVPTT